jgi:hypothetical protein
VANEEKSRISGKDAAYVALDAAKYPPVHISEVDSSANGSDGAAAMEKLPAPVSDQPGDGERRQAPPRVRKPSPIHDQYLAPTPDLAGYRARLREAFGNTMSDEFVDVMLGKVVEALKPTPWDQLEEATLNAALAIIASAHCRSELESAPRRGNRRYRVRGTSLSASKPEAHDRGLHQHLRPLRQQTTQASTRNDPDARPASARP